MRMGDTVQYSFATRMALYYLQQQNIALQSLDAEGNRVRLGQAMFQRLTENAGGYHQVDDGGYQILLNWRDADFDAISLRQVLAGESPRGGWRDRIVLIGVTSEGAKDYFYTPYRQNPFKPPPLMSGVSIHAQIVSQLVSEALGERSQLRPVSNRWTWLWTGCWAFFGTILGGRVLSRARQFGFSGLGLLVWGGSWLIIFGTGVWIPGVMGSLAFLSTGLCSFTLSRKYAHQLRQTRTSERLQAEIADHPHAARLALKMLEASRRSD